MNSQKVYGSLSKIFKTGLKDQPESLSKPNFVVSGTTFVFEVKFKTNLFFSLGHDNNGK